MNGAPSPSHAGRGAGVTDDPTRQATRPRRRVPPVSAATSSVAESHVVQRDVVFTQRGRRVSFREISFRPVACSGDTRFYTRRMPERLDRVTVALNGGDVVLSWASREALMQRLQETMRRATSGARSLPSARRAPSRSVRRSAPNCSSFSMIGSRRCRTTSSSYGTR
jgi:hypothetical protein